MQSHTEDVVTKPVGQRLRYSRAEVLARYDYGKTIAVEYDSLDAITKAVTGIRVRPKTQRKKTSHSQSSDGEVNKSHVNEDLTVQETDPNNNTGWHRKTRHAVNAQSGHITHYPHQRRPSGPTGGGGDVDTLNSSPQVSGPLRPTNEIKRGGHGDWSRGCAGWRQRSYSGSEQSDVYHHNYSNHRGRGNGHEPDGGVTGRGGRGRGRGRQAVTHRESTGATGQSHNSNTSNHRPVSCLADVNPLLSTETKSVRAYSKSFSIDPPPGFELPVHENTEKLSSSSTLSMGGTLQADEFLDNNYPPVEKITSTPPPNDHLQLLTMTTATTPTTTSTEVGTTTKPYHLSSRTWYYVDLLKHIQGPFTDQQMATWLAAGYLSLGVKIRRNCDECFLSLADHMNLANRVPFWSGYNQPPITHENLSSITSRLRFNENLLNAQISFPETPTTTTTATTPNSSISGSTGTNINQLCSNSTVSNTTDNPAVVSPVGSTSDESQTQLQQQKVTSIDDVQVESVDSKQPTSTLSSTITSSPPPPPAAALREDLKTSTSINPSVLTEVNDTTALLNLCTDAQNILTHTTKIEAERLALANKLAEINNTTAKLLSNLCSSQLNSNLTETLIQTTNAVQSELARLLISPSNEANGNNSNQIHSNNNNNNGSINKRDNLDTQNTPPQKPSLEMTTTTAHNNKSSTPSKVLDNTHQKDIRGSVDDHISCIDEKINSSSSYDSKDESSSIMLDSNQLTGGGGQLSHHEDVDATGDDDDGDGGGENVSQEKSSINTSVNTTLQTTTTTTGKADSSNDAEESGGGGVSKKSKRKNKKANKKLTAEQEKQLAWEIEFNRRKAAALEQKLAEEARLKKIAEEEALALAMEKALADQEKARALAEQSRREALRMKADSELSRLKLPESARWAAGSVNTTEKPPANDLRSIQAAQEAEEEEKRRHRLLLAEQMSALTPSPANVSSSVKPTLAWSEIAKSETHSTATTKTNDASKDERSKRTAGVVQPLSNPTRPQKSNPHQHHTTNATSVSSIKSVETSTPPGHISSLSSVSNVVEMKNTATKVQLINSIDNNTNNNTTTKKCQSTAPIPSIWDLPVSSTLDNTTNSVGVKKASNKKKKKNCSTMNSFTVKEELVHWCESQLSSMPLSGIDLPTLVDLLCDLQTSDEIVEFIETSLGRSKRVTKFSKDFLQKRALLLNVAIE